MYSTINALLVKNYLQLRIRRRGRENMVTFHENSIFRTITHTHRRAENKPHREEKKKEEIKEKRVANNRGRVLASGAS